MRFRAPGRVIGLCVPPVPRFIAAASAGALLCTGSAVAQVMSVRPSAALPAGSFNASARLQYGLTQPQSYQGAVLGGGRIDSSLQAAVVGAGGFVASTSPPFWSQTGRNNFSLSYSAATQTLSLTVRRLSGAVQFSINDSINLTGSQGLLLDWVSNNASSLVINQLTAAGTSVAIGPGTWSGTVLENSMLTGWDLGADWTLTGSVQLLNAGADAIPRLQADATTDGLAYQLSDQGAGRPAVINYGIFQALTITDAEFAQAAYGGTDGVLTTDILSRAPVIFDVAGTVELSGGVFDLDSPLVDPAFFGNASLVKLGAGRLNLTGTNSYSGSTVIADGTLGIVDVSQLGAGTIFFGDGSGVGTPVLAADLAGGGSGTLAQSIVTQAADATFNVESGVLGLSGTFTADVGTDIVKLGNGTLSLSIDGSYDGILDAVDGTVVLNTADAVGASGIRVTDATVVAARNLTLGPAQSLEAAGTGTLAGLAGTEAFRLRGDFISGAADQLTIRGLRFRLDGDGTPFQGQAVLDGASFTMVDNTLTGSIDATAGSLLDATGTIGGSVSLAASTLRLTGDDPLVPGALAVTGDLSFDASSSFVANVFLNDIAPGVRASDRVTVAGSTAMNGNLVAFWNMLNTPASNLIPDAGQSRSWTVVTSAAGSGSFTSAELAIFDPVSGQTTIETLPVNGSTANAVVRYTTVFNGTQATITLTGLGSLPPDQVFDTACGPVTGAEINDIVTQLELVENTGSADASLIASLILLEDTQDIPPAFEATQQRNPYAAADVVLDSNAMAGHVAMLRLMQLRDGELGSAATKASDAAGGQAPQVASAGPKFGAELNGRTPDEGTRTWMRGYGFYEDIDEENCAECGYKAAIGAAMVGIDWAVDGGGIVGAFAGLGPGRITMDAVYGSQAENLESATAGIYGSIVPGDGGVYLQGFVLGSYNDIARTRTIDTPNITRQANSSNSAWTLSAGGEVGLNLELAERTFLQPFAGVSWGQYWGESYSETGAGSLNLTVQSQSANEWQPTAGARLMHGFEVGTDIFTPFVGAAFLAQLPVGAGWAPTYTSDFNLGVDTQLDTGPPDRYGVSFQAGVEFARIDGMTAYVAFDGAVLTGKQRFGGQIGVLVPF